MGACRVRSVSVVVATATHCTTSRPQDFQKQSDDHEDDPHSQEDRDTRDDANDEKNDAEDDHVCCPFERLL